MSRISYVFNSTRCEIELEKDISTLQGVEKRARAQYGNTHSLRFKCFSNVLENRLVRKLNELFYIRLRKFGVLNNSPEADGDVRSVVRGKMFQRLWSKHKNIAKNKVALNANAQKRHRKTNLDKRLPAVSISASSLHFTENANVNFDHPPLSIERVGSTPKRAGIPQMGYLHRFKPSWAQQLLTKRHAFNTDNLPNPNDSQSDNLFFNESSTTPPSSATSNCSDDIKNIDITQAIFFEGFSDAKGARHESFAASWRNTKLKRLKRACSKWTLQRLKLSGLIR